MDFKKEPIYQELKTHINYLASFSELELTKISENKKIKSSYGIVLNFIIRSKDEKNIRKYIKKIISKLYHPTEIIPNTIGSFIFGCNQSDYGDVDKFCSILCCNSWMSFHKTKCKQNIIIQSNSDSEDRFIFKNITDSDKCYIYILDDFNGFYEHEIEKLSSRKIKFVQLLSTKNSKHFKVNEFIPLNSVTKISTVKNNTDIIDKIADDSWVALIFCAILIIIIIFLFTFRRGFL